MEVKYINTESVIKHSAKRYFAFDGKDFSNKHECTLYEMETLNAKNIKHINTKHIENIDGTFSTAYYIDSEQKLIDIKRYISAYYGININGFIDIWKYDKPDWFIFKYDDSGDYPDYDITTFSEEEKSINEYLIQFNE